MIDKYFSAHDDKSFNELFNREAEVLLYKDSIYGYELFNNNNARVFFRSTVTFRDYPLIENGKRVGVATLTEPHTTIDKTGTFICSGVKNLSIDSIKRKKRKIDLSISAFLYKKGLTIKINNNQLNITITCEKLIPESLLIKTIENIPLP